MLRDPRPRPDHLEAKAKAKARTVRGQGQGHDFGSSSSRTVLEDPIPGKDIRGVSYSALESTAVCVCTRLFHEARFVRQNLSSYDCTVR